MKRTSQPASLLPSLLAALLLVLALVTGCGGSDSSTADRADDGGSAGGPPTNASVDEFCGTFLDMIQQANEAGGDMTDAEAIEVAKETADKLETIGTPEGIPEDARRAFELAIEKIRTIPDDATRQEMDAIAGDLTPEQKEDLDALTAYVTSTCMSLPSDAPSS